MELYATTTSERASKGQGGNKFLTVEINIHDKLKPALRVFVNRNGDKSTTVGVQDCETGAMVWGKELPAERIIRA